jgi:hypothetical protein
MSTPERVCPSCGKNAWEPESTTGVLLRDDASLKALTEPTGIRVVAHVCTWCGFVLLRSAKRVAEKRR